ncbi:MAG: hypothetical protein ACK5Z3_16680 [Pseudanabaena sp.]|jgi:hypothetical protein
MKHADFWSIASSGGAFTSKKDPRWLITLVNLDAPLDAAISDRRVKLTEIPNLYGQTLEDFHREQDLVMTVKGLVYSERVKALFEKECPGNAEFAPIEIRGTPVPLQQRYYVVHAVHALPKSCIVPESILTIPSNDKSEDAYAFRFKIDPAKVPEHVKFFCIADKTYRHYVRDSLRRSMMRARLLGASYINT